ncbi:hypothetical protein OC834_007188 [Tilletia horrida]|nr:hypothetical protein OC834_007188 [Tilletia horrida]
MSRYDGIPRLQGARSAFSNATKALVDTANQVINDKGPDLREANLYPADREAGSFNAVVVRPPVPPPVPGRFQLVVSARRLLALLPRPHQALTLAPQARKALDLLPRPRQALGPVLPAQPRSFAVALSVGYVAVLGLVSLVLVSAAWRDSANRLAYERGVLLAARQACQQDFDTNRCHGPVPVAMEACTAFTTCLRRADPPISVFKTLIETLRDCATALLTTMGMKKLDPVFVAMDACPAFTTCPRRAKAPPPP